MNNQLGKSMPIVLRTLTLLFLTSLAMAAPAPLDPKDFPAPIRVACVGDSITAGFGAPKGWSYPDQLRMILGAGWEVGNFGVSGRTLLRQGDRPYVKEAALTQAKKFKPDAVILLLGTNDTKPQNWAHVADFPKDYADLVGEFRALDKPPRIYVGRPCPVVEPGVWGINEAGVQTVIGHVDALAARLGLEVIDFHAALDGQPKLQPDRVHPNAVGYGVLAATAFTALTGKPAPTMPKPPTTETLVIANRKLSLKVPVTPAPGRPWLWVGEFGGHLGNLEDALVERGWHVAYFAFPNQYGAPAAMDAWDKVYEELNGKRGLAAKPALLGISRGGLYVNAWARRHPDRVSVLYLDNAVCDLRSWPAGMPLKATGAGSPAEWASCKTIYGWADDEEAKAKAFQPTDGMAAVIAQGVFLISVHGTADRVVPFVDNGEHLVAAWKAAGGRCAVFPKEGGDHHPHGLPDNTPVIDLLCAEGVRGNAF
ncbi:MAG: GDSL-type esterase/lipase family protein [bacterium]